MIQKEVESGVSYLKFAISNIESMIDAVKVNNVPCVEYNMKLAIDMIKQAEWHLSGLRGGES